MQQISELIRRSADELRGLGVETVRRAESFSFGTEEECRKKLMYYFLQLDNTVSESDFVWIPEYNEIAKWLSNTGGKGLLLKGDCGRGKSTIVMSVLPVLFITEKNKILKPISAGEMNLSDRRSEFQNVGWMTVAKRWSIVIDELGTENKETNFNEPYEPFCNIIDECEKRIKLLIVTTNLNDEQLLTRYGVRTFDRLMRLCNIIEFAGDSYRK